MGDVQELAREIGVSRHTVSRLVWGCVKEGIIPPPKRGKWNNLILPGESKRILYQMYSQRKREVSSVISLAEEVGRCPRAVHAIIQRLVKKGVISSPKKVRGKIFLSHVQEEAIRNYYRWLDGEGSVVALARELRVLPRQVRYKIYRLVEKGKFPPPKKIRRGRLPEMVLSEEIKEEIRRSFAR